MMSLRGSYKAMVYADAYCNGVMIILDDKEGGKTTYFLTPGEARDLARWLDEAVADLEGSL